MGSIGFCVRDGVVSRVTLGKGRERKVVEEANGGI